MKFPFTLILLIVLPIFFLSKRGYSNTEINNTIYSIQKFKKIIANDYDPTFPTTTSSYLDAINVNCNSIQLSWTNGNGKGRLIVARKEKPVNVFPKNGSSYNSSSIFGKGTDLGEDNFVVYKGNANNTTIKIDNKNTYHFAIFEYNEYNNNYLYLTYIFPTKSIVIDRKFPATSLASDTIACINSQITLDAGNGFSSYLWSNGSENKSITIENLGDTGHFVYSVTAFNDNGCSVISSVNITFEFCTGLYSTPTAKTFDVFPNPGTNFNLKIKKEGNIVVKVLTLLGALAYEENFINPGDSNFKNIDLGHLDEGIYFIQIENKEDIQMKKIIIKK